MPRLAEPTVLIAIFGIALRAGTTSLDGIITRFAAEPLLMLNAGHLLAFIAFFIVALAENGRLPVDNPATHLELTMIHEAMILEYSGRLLALVEWAAGMKLFLFLTLLSNLFFPWGVALTNTPIALFSAFLALAVKLLLFAAAIALGGNIGCQAPSFPCAGTFGRVVYGRVVGRGDRFFYQMMEVAMSAEVLSKAVNLLSFVALGLTILLIIRTSLEGQVRVFALQSFVLAAALPADRALQRQSRIVRRRRCAGRRQRRHDSARAQSRRGENRLGASRGAVSGDRAGAHYLRAAHDRRVLRDDSHRRLESLAHGGCHPAGVRGRPDRLFYHGESPPRGRPRFWDFSCWKTASSYSLSWRRTACRSSSRWGFFSTCLVAVLIMEVFVYHIKDNFDSIDVGELGKLKE